MQKIFTRFKKIFTYAKKFFALRIENENFLGVEKNFSKIEKISCAKKLFPVTRKFSTSFHNAKFFFRQELFFFCVIFKSFFDEI